MRFIFYLRALAFVNLLCDLCRWRTLVYEIIVLNEVQLGYMVLDYRPAIHRGLVVRQICRILSATRMVRSVDVVALPSLRTRGLRELWDLADELQKSHQNRRACSKGFPGR